MAEDPMIERWREAYAHLAPPQGTCASDEELAALVLEEASGPERDRVAEHVLGCSRCAASFRDLVDLHTAASPRRSRRATAWVALSAAAAAVLLVLLAGVLVLDPGSGTGVPGDDQLRNSRAEAVAPLDGARLEAAPIALAWSAQTGARSYRVQLYDQRAELVWEGPDSDATSIALADEAGSRLQPGSYFWVVEVSGQAATSRLGPYWFHLD